MSYFPMDRRILKSSLYRKGSPTDFKVMSHLLLIADPRDGSVTDQVWVMAEDTNIPIEEFKASLETLAAPDAFSRTKTDEGRRIRFEGDKIVIINYLKHRDSDHSTPRVKAWRERKRSETVGNGRKRRSTVSETVQRPLPVTETTDTDTETDTTERTTTDSRADARASTPKQDFAWSKEACDAWIERYEGTAPGGTIGRHLKPLVDKHGWPVVGAAWRTYLEMTPAQYANPARFSATFGQYRSAPAPPPAPPPPPIEEQDPDARDFFAQMREKLKGQMPIGSWATWIRGVDGWKWEDDEDVLVLAAPGRQNAEMLRGAYKDKLRSAAAELGKQLKFKIIVVEEPATVHNGSVR